MSESKMVEKKVEEIPPCGIRVDKEGVWYFEGKEMFRRDIVNYFYQNLIKDGAGRYIIVQGDERCYLEVEDTPFIVKAVFSKGSRERGDEELELLLCDDTVETLDPTTLWVGPENVLYCLIRNGTFKARFSRPGYYQLAEYIDHDQEGGCYVLTLNGKKYAIK